MNRIQFDIHRFCIQTGAKKAYERLIRDSLKAKAATPQSAEIETQIEALIFFLTNADFMRLRCTYPELDGSAAVQITLIIPDNYRDMEIVANQKVIKPEWKSSSELSNFNREMT